MSERPRFASRLAAVFIALPLFIGHLSWGAHAPPSAGEERLQLVFVPGMADEPFDEGLCAVNCTSVVTQGADFDHELVYPCREPVTPPVGRLRYWIECDRMISPYSSVLHLSGRSHSGPPAVVRDRLVPAGLVALADDLVVAPEVSLRLLHIDSHSRLPVLQQELSRRVSGDRAYQGVLMPTGMIVGGLFDSSIGEYAALTAPVSVSAQQTTYLKPEPPREGSDLLVVLDRPDFVHSVADDDVELQLLVEESPKPVDADVVIRSANRLFGIWYRIEGRYANLRVSSSSVWLPLSEVSLRPRKVSSIRAGLRKLPQLSVLLELPESMDRDVIGLALVDSRAHGEVARVELPPDTQSYRFEAAPAANINVVGEAGPWRIRTAADLSDGISREIILAPEVVEVQGTVFRGDHGHPATVEFFTSGTNPELSLGIETDSEGAYEATLYRTGRYLVDVQLADATGPPRHEIVRVLEDSILDFHLPASSYTARVVDAETGEGIPDATVHCGNESLNGRVQGRILQTDGDGRAALPPMREGTIVLVAEADGYRSARQELQSTEDESENEITINLQPADGGTIVHVLLPDGAPANGAEVMAFRSLESGVSLWQGKCDSQGTTVVPEGINASVVLARHPRAGFGIQSWPLIANDPNGNDWQLPPRAPRFELHVHDSSGRSVRYAPLAFRVGGVWLSGSSAAFGAGFPGADGRGRFIGDGFPDLPIAAAAWALGARPSISELDAFAVAVGPPWISEATTVELVK